MNLKCKFRLDEVTKYQTSRRVKLTATNSKEGDNVDWSQYSPSGTFEIMVTNQAAFPQIDNAKIGELVYINLISVDQA